MKNNIKNIENDKVMEENYNLEDNLKELKEEYDVSILAPKGIKNEKDLQDWVISIAPKVQEYFDIERGDYFWKKEHAKYNGQTVVKLTFWWYDDFQDTTSPYYRKLK